MSFRARLLLIFTVTVVVVVTAVGAAVSLSTRRAFERVDEQHTAALVAQIRSEIVRRGVELDAPLRLTWSCYQAEERACGRCDSCALRLRAFREAGVEDPIPYA